jgi:hypothetical protein
MKLFSPGSGLKLAAICLVSVALLVLMGTWIYRHYKKQNKGFYTICVFYDSLTLQAADRQVIKFIVGKRTEELNKEGGIGGRNIQIRYLDDKGNPDTTYKAVKKTISDPNLIAYLGCWGSTKTARVAKQVGEAKIPFIGGYSVTELGRPYPNMFTYEIGVKQFANSTYNLLKVKSKKVAFIGNTGDLFSTALLKEIKALNRGEDGIKLVMEKWYPFGYTFTPEALTHLTDSLKTEADFLILSVKVQHTNIILKSIWQHGLKFPIFCAYVDIPEIDASIPGFKQAELYDISVLGIPSALNLRSQVLKDKYKYELPESGKLDFQLGYAALIADAIGMIKAASEMNTRLPAHSMRERITNGMQFYLDGVKIYRGRLRDWYFTPERALASDAVLGWKPANYDKPILAPFQFLHADTALTKTQVLYTNIDLIRIDRVNDEESSFNARFYLEINSKSNITIRQIDFANAARNNINHEPLVDIKLLRADSAGGEKQLYNYLYKVSGKFFFSRNLKNYPFDKQQFTISLQTNSALAPFLIQPPGKFERDTIFRSPGWIYVSNFIGYDQDMIYTAKNFITRQKHIPYYKFNFTYVLKRAQVDFFLKVLTPLLSILLITYFSVYIPHREFEALCAIQVTALLSSIALYFSSYNPEMQNATISDKIFIFTYLMITSLIGTSILLYSLQHKNTLLTRGAQVYQRFVFPAIVIVFTVLIRWF